MRENEKIYNKICELFSDINRCSNVEELHHKTDQLMDYVYILYQMTEKE